MKKTESSETREPANDGFVEAVEERRTSYLFELWEFARSNKKWWLTPIIVVLLLIGLLVVVTGTGAGALLYPLF